MTMKHFYFISLTLILVTSVVAQDSSFQKMLNYSRPGKYHKVLEQLKGSWKYKGGHPDSSGKVDNCYYGTFVWKSFANGRFLIADVTSSKIQMPIQDGKSKETNYKAVYTIGYNNIKERYEETIINNMIGSDISFAEGNYDSAKNTITFDYEVESVPSMKQKLRDIFIFIDKNHYTIESFDEENGMYVRNNKVECTRVISK
jgi:hypothetical protein